MKTTYFKPSIHGWPFGNTWRKSFVYDTITFEHMGFCGGMCWRALQRFYNAIPIPRDTPKPDEGDPLYDELWDAQVNSLPAGTIEEIFEWQLSPDLGHWNNPLSSQGSRTQKEWPKVRASLDASKPVTLTLVASSNDANPKHLEDSHRVVAYAYQTGLVSPADGAPEGADTKVSLWIYDPNYPDDDGVVLTFYLGAKQSNIRLKHNRGMDVHGFFKDDKDRSYAFSGVTYVKIGQCQQTAIVSATRAVYDLQFSWQCRFVPYFNILVNGGSWRYNDGAGQAKSLFAPVSKADKQCAARSVTLTVQLQLPRALSTVSVRLLDAGDYEAAVEVDAQPVFLCRPYLHNRARGEAPCISDYKIQEADLFIKTPEPSEAAVQQLDTSPFRWVMEVPKAHVDTRSEHDDLTTAIVEVFENTCLGNVVSPVFANFEARNLAGPLTKTGQVKIFKNGLAAQTADLDPLSDEGQKIFDGFQDNPADYDQDTRVELTYRCVDHYGVAVQGKAFFYGRSIIHEESVVTISPFDPDRLVRLEAVAERLVERGLVEAVINLPPSWPDPHPGPGDPVELRGKLRSSLPLRKKIAQEFKSTWSDPQTWKAVWAAQAELLQTMDPAPPLELGAEDGPGAVRAATTRFRDQQQRAVDALALNIVAARTVNCLLHDPLFSKALKSL